MSNKISLTNIRLYLQNEANVKLSNDDISQMNSVWIQCDTEDEQGNQVSEGDGSLNKNELSKFIAKLMTSSKKLYNVFSGFLHNNSGSTEIIDSLKSMVVVDNESDTTISYDENGHISRIIDKANGTDISYVMDSDDGHIVMDSDTNNDSNYRTYDNNGELDAVSENGIEKLYDIKEDGTKFVAMAIDAKTRIITMYRDDGSIYSEENSEDKVIRYYDKNNNLISIIDNKYISLPNNGAQLSPETIANNLRLLYSYVISADIDQQKELKDMMSLINADNYDSISDAAYEHNLQDKIFTGFVSFYQGDDKSEILAEKFQMFLTKAKEKNVYTKDFETMFESAKNDATKLAQMLQRLMNRIGKSNYVTNDTLFQPNGEIDAAFQQGNTGDCWFISSIISIKNNPELKAKLDDMIHVIYAADGVTVREVVVNIKGKEYKIAAEELQGALEYSSGDLDVRALEIAVNRYCFENNLSDINEGGFGKTAFEILFDDVSVMSQDNITEDNFDILKKDNIVAVTKAVDAEDITQKSGFLGKDSEGNDVSIESHHAYSISKVDDEFVYLINPWSSESNIRMTIDDFKKAFNGFDYINI